MPFYWVGALFSAAFLAFVITVFGLLLKLGGRAATETRETILPGLIEGIREWAGRHPLPTPVSPHASEEEPSLEPTTRPVRLRLEHVGRGR